MEVAHEENLPIGLAQDMVLEVEDAGGICRDDGNSGVSSVFSAGAWGGGGSDVRWWVNVFVGYSWDGHVFQD